MMATQHPTAATPVSTAPLTPASARGSSAIPAADETATGGAPVALPLRGRDKEEFQKVMLDRVLERDQRYHSNLIENARSTQATIERIRQKAAEYQSAQQLPPAILYGRGYDDYGNGTTDNQSGPMIVYPMERRFPGRKTVPPLRWRRKDMLKQAEQHEELVPIRLDIEWDKIKLRDTFTWNLHDRLVSIDMFTRQLIEDLHVADAIGLPQTGPVYNQIVQQMHGQLVDFYPFVHNEEDALDPELPYSAYKNDDMRILIKLNITAGRLTLVDQFEWEINNPLNSPEEFAVCMTKDLNLPREFMTAIAHCIREQTQLFTRSLYVVGHPFDGRPIEDQDLAAAFLPSPLPNTIRPQQQAKEFTPYLYELSEVDLERNETVMSREQRRQKRSVNRRGGPSLPDLKDRQRTVRTLVISSVIPGAATSLEDSRMFKRPAGVSGRGGRRGVGAHAGDGSDSEDSEDSGPESPAPASMFGAGTARTRGIRSAALGAAQRMANMARSETPEASSITHHHETRTNRRVPRDSKEGAEEPAQLLVTLRLDHAKLRRALTQPRPKSASVSVSTSATPVRGASTIMAEPMPPPPPSVIKPPLSAPAAGGNSQSSQSSRPDAPQIPSWLASSLKQLRDGYPWDNFEGIMKYLPCNPATDPPTPIPAGEPLPPSAVHIYLPRIRCGDCPGKSYTPGPNETAEKFVVHLKNKQHRERVDARWGHPTTPSVPGNPANSMPQGWRPNNGSGVGLTAGAVAGVGPRTATTGGGAPGPP